MRFREPLHLPMIVNENITIQVRSFNLITNVGIEDILFKGNWNSYPESIVHHKNDIHDYAWNALRFDNVENGWLRNCDFKDWNQGVYFDGCAAMTVDNVRFTGKRGHMSIHTRRFMAGISSPGTSTSMAAQAATTSGPAQEMPTPLRGLFFRDCKARASRCPVIK